MGGEFTQCGIRRPFQFPTELQRVLAFPVVWWRVSDRGPPANLPCLLAYRSYLGEQPELGTSPRFRFRAYWVDATEGVLSSTFANSQQCLLLPTVLQNAIC